MARRAWVALVLLVALPGSGCAANEPDRRPLDPLFPHALFDEPLAISGSFGDHRNSHFHAGLDLSTKGVVGRAVHAPIDGQIVRVRASGVGYGRSLYLETGDGRLLVFGHLDGFAAPIAAYVATKQDSAGQYEQDLWPERGRFPVRGGDVIAWTGRSGTGTPHLHFEVRRIDTALHPLRAGLAVPDTSTPRIASVTLVPIDDTTGTVAPWHVDLARRDTASVRAFGRFRVVIEALDQNGHGGWDIEPWRVRVSDGRQSVECRFDSVSWATDMPASDYTYDRGRWTRAGSTSLLMAAPAHYRPPVITSSVPRSEAAGVFRVDEGTPTVLEIEAEDLAGHVTRASVTVSSAPRRTLGPVRPLPPIATLDVRDTGERHVLEVPGRLRVEIPADAMFEPARLAVLDLSKEVPRFDLDPPVALRSPVTIAMPLPKGQDPRRSAILHYVDGEWDFVGNDFDPVRHEIRGSTRKLGVTMLVRDADPPAVTLLAPPRTVVPSPYPRWSLEARVVEKGSGVDARVTRFEIDGRRVATEWDDVENTMRWRPLHAPARGTHRVVAIAIDRCGNERRRAGRFVIR